MVILRLLVCLLPVLLVSSQSLAAGPENPALRCQSQKALAAAKYAECQVRAEGVANDALRAARIARCEDLLKWRFSRAEILAEGQCPTTNDYRSIEAAVALHIRTVNAALDGPPLAAGNCGAGGVPFAYSYMVTNRAAPFATSESQIVPAAPGTLSFFTAAGAYQGTDPQKNYQAVSQEVFLTRLAADLARTSSNGTQHLGVYTHGLGNVLTDAMTETAQFGCSLAGSGAWPGLLIGFSWPSYDMLDSGLFYATEGPPLPPLTPQRSGSIRDNILGSRASFAALLSLLQSEIVAKSNTPVDWSFLTHSEGNYMLMAGLAGMTAPPTLSQCLMLAADISASSLQSGGEGAAITQACQNVTVYYSGADVTLGASNYEYFQYHVEDFPTRLGLIGPYYGFAAPETLPGNVTGVDCSSVTVYPAVAFITDVHSSYRSVPKILTDMSQVLQGLPATGRAAFSGTSQGFRLTP